jgi:cellobiose-specific phosphotransferase system component IIA
VDEWPWNEDLRYSRAVVTMAEGSAFEQYTAILRAKTDAIAQAHDALNTALANLVDAHDAITRVTADTNDPDVIQAVQGLAQAHVDVVWVCATLTVAGKVMADYRSSIGDDAPTQYRNTHARGAESGRFERLRSELPPPVTRGRGQKTHGRWIGANDQENAMTSGYDDTSRRVNQILEDIGCPYIPITAAGDVEMKLAALMRDRGTTDPEMRNVTLLINQDPCRGELGCDTLVPAILPTGYTLTVHAPNYRKRYVGGQRPWWS